MGSDPERDRVLVGGLEPVRRIVIVEHDPTWPDRFEAERARIAAALGDRALDIQHIGSTSVPGLAAKPIVDICVTVADVDDDAAFGRSLIEAGYELRVREQDHRMFRTPERDVHVHVYAQGSHEIADYLDLRDWLRVDAEGRARYESVKRELSMRAWADVNEYADAKSDVVQDTLRRARAWRCERHRAVVRRLFDEVWNGRQVDVVDELYSPDVAFDYTPYAALVRGRDAIRGSLERAWTAFPDYHEELLSMTAEGWRVAIHLRITGTQSGHWGPLAPTGKRLEFEEMALLTFDSEGLVVHQRGIVDNLNALRQAGVIPWPRP
ncbi:MAG TPA: GrpB family protein [Acidimicrobiales bacterium]|nr:GrpB family protein [Acidimicrobiales bacterium]